ncbi:MFS transporter [Enterococcus pallens]|uniref:Major facilitator superfamily (MFS) profile domain-containing protein n=1 Tax=Enterococcus pallens ATCC BAA-351 TaxID=1158607 RepID=R2QEU2_9ENTE|nr:MFS transporter [Enterococcus pallens]EOH93763.1 hypothetical protein UAU_02459 [Enterococcus pallens ATCC BAA-351]EOU24603.1 hypothetical protein I588_00590 [Enterococcus pallens ATCC BAA-351]OJG79575.1 hypothetical protein RV10_GL000702 [Enterococcus pallens]
MNKKISQKMFKVALLSISLLLTSSGSIAITVSKMQETFADRGPTAVEALVTASNITVMIFVLLSAFLVRMLGTKKTVLLGLFLAGAAGVVPMFSADYTIVYVSRLVLGAGLGMFNSLAVSLINEFYNGDERNKMLGYQSAVQSIGQTITTFIAGILVTYDWHYAYGIYFLAIVSFLLFFVYVPDVENDAAADTNEVGKQTVNRFVILSSIALFFSFGFLMAIFLKASTLVQEANFANPAFLGTALSLFTLVGFLGNFLYGHVVKVTKHLTLVFSYAIMGIGFLIVSFAPNMAVFTAGLLISGLGSSAFLPYSFGTIMEKAPKNSANLAVSIAMVGTNLGSWISPYLLSFVGSIFNNHTAQFSLLFSGASFLAFAVLYLLISGTFKKEKSAAEAA